MAGNKNQAAAKAGKNDEFYTQLPDIENELMHYTEHFRGKTVLCNCDDPYESNFFKYFAMNFSQFGLKKLICTCYDGSPMSYSQTSFISQLFGEKPGQNERKAYLLKLTDVKDVNGDGAVDLRDVDLILQQNPPTLLKGNGDFRSPECIELLKEADIVVTNPPFSLFRKYLATLIEYKKKFLIIGDLNNIHKKEIFPLLKENIIWMGYGFNKTYVFKTTYVNELEANRKYVRSKGYNPDEGYIKNSGQCWFTNLDHKKRHEPIDLYKRYSDEEYTHYDNFDAIDVGNVADIPLDFDGVMGVPDTFLGRYCPEQFELIGIGTGNMGKDLGVKKNYRGRTDIQMTTNGKPHCPYSRILIRKRKSN